MNRHAWGSLICVALVLAGSGPSARTAQPAPTLEVPAVGQETGQILARGDAHAWHIDLAASDFVEIAVAPLGITLSDAEEWPGVTVTGPDGASVFESTEPHIALSMDVGARMVVSFVAERSGPYRVNVTARRQTAARMPYRLSLERRGLVSDEDRVRLAVHRLWREGARLFARASRESLQASVQTFEDALTLLGPIGDHEAEAMTLCTIAAVRYAMSDAPRGTAADTRALEIWRQLGREREEGLTLSDLGLLAYLGYDHPTARTYYDQALARHRAVHDVVSEALTLVRLGWVEFAAGEMSRVIDLNQQAIPLWRDAGNVGGESVSLNDLGRAYADLGDVSQALDAYERSLATRPSDINPRGAGIVLMRIGQVYLSVADWQRAFDALHQALTLVRRANDSRNEAAVLSNLGLAYSRIGDRDEAVRYLEPALDLARRVNSRNVEANVLGVLGVEAYLAGQLERSRTFFQQALSIQTAITDVRGQAATLRYLATTELALGSPRAALEAITRSLERSQASGPSASGLTTLATVHAALGDEAQARINFQHAIDRARRTRARNQEAASLALFGRFESQHGRPAEARELLAQALAIHESVRGLIVDPDLRMSYSSASLTPYQLYIDVLMDLERRSPGEGFAAAAFQTNERARARGLLEMLATSGVDIREGVDKALVDRERSLRWNLNAKAAIQTSLLTGKRDDRRLAVLEKEIADLSRAWRETTTMIRQQSPTYASLTEPEPLTAADAGKLLDPGTVLLEFAPGETQSWLFAVTNTSFDSFALPSRRHIEETAREIHRLLTARQPVGGEASDDRQARVRRADAELAERSRALSDLVLGPVADKLANEWRGRRLTIVATGALEYVPFAALPVPGRAAGSHARLVSTHEIVTLPSASSLALLRREGPRRHTPHKTIAVFADPVFAADDPRVSRTSREERRPAVESTRALETRAFEPFVADGARGSLARLPFSRAEALAVATQVPPASLLQATDFDATLALATNGRLNDYRVIHFATHGLINTTRPELSGLALSLVDRNGRSLDGFLRLNTIYNLRLSADLVVLSACQTALGKEVAGEGLVGLTRGFMFAGARRVIASLWQVSDVATAELMKKFYAGMLQQHLPPAAALRSAQLEMSKDPRWASPYYWAGFVLQGDWQQ